MRLADELATRLLPVGLDEGAYARNRPHDARPPTPRVGDEVFFRRNEWDSDEDLWRMRVVEVQDPDDKTSEWATNLWELIRGNWTGAPLFDRAGEMLILPVADPWPWVLLRWEGEIPKGSEHAWMHRLAMTFESRVRGAAGWLPLDYEQTRRVWLPGQTLTMPTVDPIARRAEAGYVEPLRPEDGTWRRSR